MHVGLLQLLTQAVHSCRLFGFFVHRSASGCRVCTDEAEAIWMDAEDADGCGGH